MVYNRQTKRPYFHSPCRVMKAVKPRVCVYWRAGKCNRNPCKFSHAEPKTEFAKNTTAIRRDEVDDAEKRQQIVCHYWALGRCSRGNNCKFLHSWCQSDNKFSLLARLEGYKEVVGIELPDGSDKLYSAARDGTMRVWDFDGGKCINVLNKGAEIRCLYRDDCWVFAGMTNMVKAWKIGEAKEFCLDVAGGQVYSLATHEDTLFAGANDGSIYSWKLGLESDQVFNSVTTLEGHTGPVECLTVGAGKLFSGSTDGTVRMWDPEKFVCVETLTGHEDTVTSLLCWSSFLLSSSLDGSVRAWGMSHAGNLETVYTHKEGQGIVSIFGMLNDEGKPILFCSCKDNIVRLYELPSFTEKGKIFAKREVRAMQNGPDGSFFTGDGTGAVSIWKWSSKL
ncbi:hypothetical protein K2173_002155 [Erythroxylum novogranatense]|uniref:C3H1-type domain-containing protein n=1 Tax=Erythroxylum novogranatense TaxID=1862640 RepID=A0AAV8SPS8_9ROSI|nr:hypothetical protein K2173_002155 [Erythroxylum novogranatense]